MAKSRSPARLKLSARDAAERRAGVVGLVEHLPEATTVAHGTHLSLEVRGKRFAWYLENHHGDGRLALNCKALPGTCATLASAMPDRFDLPKYLGQHGWVGLWLDLPQTSWAEVEELLTQAYRMTAPKSLLAQLRGSA